MKLKQPKFIWSLALGLVISLCFACATLPNRSTPTAKAAEIYLPPRQDFRIVVISDLNSQYGSIEYEPEVIQAIALMSEWQPDLVLCGGDAIAGQKASLTEAQINAMWQAFDRHIAKPLRQQQIPFGFTIGNHDGSGAIKEGELIFQGERELARDYWLEHQNQLGLNSIDRGDFPFYYSFQQDEIFFLVWDASTDNFLPEQLAWIERALKSDTARQAKTRIAIGHLPLYPIATAKNKPGEYLAKGETMRSLLEENQVQMYISGHHHVYYPGTKGNLELLHAGALGQGSRQLIGSDLSPHPTVTVIDLEIDSAKLTYTTYNAQTWELIDSNKLPLSIESESGTIFRSDFVAN